MSENNPEQPFTEEEIQENSRVDAVAILAIVLIVVGLTSYFASL
ncbi:MAG: hypothetical protein WEB57_05210 [Pseudohongiellaceae bacterium]